MRLIGCVPRASPARSASPATADFRAGGRRGDPPRSPRRHRAYSVTVREVRCSASRQRANGKCESLSIWQPVELGIDERGAPVRVGLGERNCSPPVSRCREVRGPEPDRGARCALAGLPPDPDRRQTSRTRALAVVRGCFIGLSITEAIDAETAPEVMDTRYGELLDTGRRKITPACGHPVVLVVFDELAYFSATVGEAKQQKNSSAWFGTVAAAAPPGSSWWPRRTTFSGHHPHQPAGLFGYRWAFRCTTDASSDVILGHGWANQGYSAAEIDRLLAASGG